MYIEEYRSSMNSEDWKDFWSYNGKESVKDKNLPVLAIVMFFIFFSMSLAIKDTLFTIAALSTYVFMSFLIFLTMKVNSFLRGREAKSEPFVLVNTAGYQVGKSYIPWPFAFARIVSVEIIEFQNYYILKIATAGRAVGYNTIMIPFNKKDSEEVNKYQKYLSNKISLKRG